VQSSGMAVVAPGLRKQLDRGLTLPASWYSDPEIHRLEQERIYRRSWQYAGPAERVAEPGTFFTCRAGDVPIVVTRDREGALRGFVNVCRHRGHEVASGCGRRESLQCP
jgi:phenylpropionate dioxygenase-like ring-hydroxylating dioxygenase large terminal subunit